MYARRFSNRKKLNLIAGVDLLKNDEFLRIIFKNDQPLGADDFLRQAVDPFPESLAIDEGREWNLAGGKVVVGPLVVIVLVHERDAESAALGTHAGGDVG